MRDGLQDSLHWFLSRSRRSPWSTSPAALLTRHLLAFARRQVMRVETHPLADVLERSATLLERVLEGLIELRTRIHPGTWPVRVDAVQLEQVIINMAVNAQDAMPGGGTLVLATENIRVSTEDASKDPQVPAGDYAVLSLSDTGTGMDELPAPGFSSPSLRRNRLPWGPVSASPPRTASFARAAASLRSIRLRERGRPSGYSCPGRAGPPSTPRPSPWLRCRVTARFSWWMARTVCGVPPVASWRNWDTQ